MLFWTIVFFTFSIIKLIKGNVFYETSVAMAEAEVKKANPELSKADKDNIDKEILKNGGAIFSIGVLIMAIAEIIYYLKAVNLDIYKYPTIGMILLVILIVVKGAIKKKPDLSSELKQKEYLAKVYANKRTLFGTFNTLANLVYFGYMFYVFVLM
jgi:hypothetical protein